MDDEEKIKLATLMFYWAEGTKNGGNVDFTNSDYRMCQIWIKFLLNYCKINKDKLRLQLHLHLNMDEKTLKLWWANKLGLSLKNFCKSYIKKTKKKEIYNKKSEVGTIKIRFSSRPFLRNLNNDIVTQWHNFISSEQ